MTTLDTILQSAPPWIMGILNVTPDSFSDGGQFLDPDRAVDHARRMREEGAHLIDVGGESTRPGSLPISESEEIERVLPVVEALVREGIPVSVDTYKDAVARRCLEAGALMINDVSALRASSAMAETVARHGAFLALMYSKEDSVPHATFAEKRYEDVVETITSFLKRQAAAAITAGVDPAHILVDPGMGRFVSHDPAYSLEILARLPEMADRLRPFPVLLGISRKGFLGGNSVEEKDALSQLAAAYAVKAGASCIRTHVPRLCKLFFDAADAVLAHKKG